MVNSKTYIVDTNVLLDSPNCITTLSDNNTNKVLITYSTIMELDRLKTYQNKFFMVSKVVEALKDFPVENIISFQDHLLYNSDNANDTLILKDILNYKKLNSAENVIFISNDKLFLIRAKAAGIETQEYSDSKPYKSEADEFTGFIDEPLDGNYPYNSFFWKEGKLYFTGNYSEPKLIDYQNEIWKVTPNNVYQNAAMELLLNKDIDLISLSGIPGSGKTYLSLAAALYWVLQETQGKKAKRGEDPSTAFKKIYVFRPLTIVGNTELGYTPGTLEDKLNPYFRPIFNLLEKLNDTRLAKRLFRDGNPDNGFDSKIIEFLPISFLRGCTLENCFVIFDEMQNISRIDSRVFLSRMGKNVKCVLTGDPQQIDNKFLDKYNNGLNWVVKMLRGNKNYAHLNVKSTTSRGPIAEMIIKSGL